eukprot:247452_1
MHQRRLSKLIMHMHSKPTSNKDEKYTKIGEYHFHVYFLQNDKESVEKARWIQNQLIKEVINHQFLVVLAGINDTILTGIDHSTVPKFNMSPIGPHPFGSFEVWTPIQYFADVLSWFLINRGSLTILLHPLTDDAIKDHTENVMWLGTRYKINTSILSKSTDPPQYKELQLGYNYNSQSRYAPHNWLKV